MAVKLMPVALVPDSGLPDPSKPKPPRVPRKRRRSMVFDADGNEVLITLKCVHCGRMHPLSNFGLRKMADGAIRNQPWCRDCRSVSKPRKEETPEAAPVPVEAPVEPVSVSVVQTAAPVVSGPLQVVPLTAEEALAKFQALAQSLPAAESPLNPVADSKE